MAGAVVTYRSRLRALDAVIVPYTELPNDAGGWPRPLLDVSIADMDELRIPCLVDSGAVHTLVPRWLADAAGVGLGGAERRPLAVATTATDAAFVTTRLTAGGQTWESDVGFCHPWPYSWGCSASARSSATSPSPSGPPTSSSSSPPSRPEVESGSGKTASASRRSRGSTGDRGRDSYGQRGEFVPVVGIADLPIAAAAEAAPLTLMHPRLDSDYDEIGAFTGQACEWVVPRRTVS